METLATKPPNAVTEINEQCDRLAGLLETMNAHANSVRVVATELHGGSDDTKTPDDSPRPTEPGVVGRLKDLITDLGASSSRLGSQIDRL